MRAEALEAVKMYRMGPMFLPAVVSKVGGPLQAITIGTLGGGTNWPGASYDPETHTVFAQAANAGVSLLGLVEPPKGFSDIRYVAGVAGREFRVNEGPGFGSGADAPPVSQTQAKLAQLGVPQTPPAAAAAPAAGGGGGGLNVQGLPIVKPPYGVVSAINLDRGDLVWQVPHGDTPDAVRNHPALRGVNIPKTGQQGSVGLMVTKTLVILGDPQVTTTPEHPRGRDAARVRQADRQSGRRRLDAGAAERLADDLLRRRQAVHRRRGERRLVLGRVPGVQSAERLADAVTWAGRAGGQVGRVARRQVGERQVGRVGQVGRGSACGHASRGQANPSLSVSVSSPRGWGPAASGKKTITTESAENAEPNLAL